MQSSEHFEFDDLQGLLRFSHGHLPETCFMLLNISNVMLARQWLKTAPISNAGKTQPLPDTALQIAFSVTGLRTLGLDESLIEQFSDEFIVGMSGDESRSRRLGDIAANDPENWHWGGNAAQVPHILLLLYARADAINDWRRKIENDLFSQAFQLQNILPTLDIGMIEPFGFADGISQPDIDWSGQQSTDLHKRDDYCNSVAIGEMILGYPNEYGEYTDRPLINPQTDHFSAALKNAQDNTSLKDLGRNGSYLILRQLDQDVPGFWQYLHKISNSDADKREELAAAMVGRQRNGEPLITALNKLFHHNSKDDSIDDPQDKNNFSFEQDPEGHQCPLGAHIRRANPRTGDFPHGVTGFINRLIKILGFGLNSPDEDLIAATRFHRILRRGRSYGSFLKPEDALKADAPEEERGLQFLCLAANITRQFEFVQNAWMMSSKFNGAHQESDPLLGHRSPLLSGESTDQFSRQDRNGTRHNTASLPPFITVKGGAYFFMPGLSAIRYLIALASNRDSMS